MPIQASILSHTASSTHSSSPSRRRESEKVAGNYRENAGGDDCGALQFPGGIFPAVDQRLFTAHEKCGLIVDCWTQSGPRASTDVRADMSAAATPSHHQKDDVQPAKLFGACEK